MTLTAESSALLDGLVLDDLARSLAPPALPSVDDLAAVRTAFAPARTVGQSECWDVSGLGRGISEGRTFRLDVTLGTVQLRVFDAARSEAATDRASARSTRDADLVAAFGDVPGRGSEVAEWSRKSRARMVKTYAGLDYRPLQDGDGDLAMVTLTYWGTGWECSAPDGRTVKRHFDALARRWRREFGSWINLWKLEFQERGAPHFHTLLSVPPVVRGPLSGCVHLGPLGRTQSRKSLCRCATVDTQLWLSRTWADIVATDAAKRVCLHKHDHAVEYAKHLAAGTAVDFGATSNFTDHKRIAVYFLKHSTKSSGSKEYQHVVPAAWRRPGSGPGRFWGSCGLDRPVESVDLDLPDALTARRVLRTAARARARHIAYQRARASGASVRLALDAPHTRLRSFGHRGSLTGGWLLTNDGTALALDLARYLHDRRSLTPRKDSRP